MVMFNHPAARINFGERWHDEAEKLVARFRVRVDLENGHPRFQARISQLLQNSDFKALWTSIGSSAAMKASSSSQLKAR